MRISKSRASLKKIRKKRYSAIFLLLFFIGFFLSFTQSTSTQNESTKEALASTPTTTVLSPGSILSPGSSVTGPNTPRTLTNTDLANLTPIGTTSITQNNASGFTATLVNNQGSSFGALMFNGALDMTGTSPQTLLQGTMTMKGSGYWDTAGSAVGVILTPESSAQVLSAYNAGVTYTSSIGSQSVDNYPQGSGMGIGGLPNSFFLGRDLYYGSSAAHTTWSDTAIDGKTSTYAGGITKSPPATLSTYSTAWGSTADSGSNSTLAVIRQSDSTGTVIHGYPTSTINGQAVSNTSVAAPMNPNDVKTSTGMQAYPAAFAPDPDANNTGGTNGYAKEAMKIVWVPNADQTGVATGQVSGTMTLTITPYVFTNGAYTNTLDTANVTTLSSPLTVASKMSIGLEATNGGTFTYSSENTLFSGTTATAPVQVNYVDTNGNQIATPSYITANIGDQIDVVNPANAQDTYDYTPPTIAGYTYTKSSSPVIVQINDATYKYNKINVIYQGNTQTAQFNFAWDSAATAGTSLPVNVTTSGVTGENIVSPPLPTLPVGYQIGHVTGPDGKTYASLAAAIAANPTYTNSSNSFTLYLAPILTTQAATFQYQDSSGKLTGSSLPATITESGTINTAIPTPTPSIPLGYQLTGVVGANGLTYTTLADALTATPNFTPITTANPFTLVISPVNYDTASVTVVDLNSTYTTSIVGAEGGAFTLPVSPQVIPQVKTDSAGNVYYATVTLPNGTVIGSKDTAAGNGSSDTASGITASGGNITISGTYTAATQNYVVNYVLHQAAVQYTPPAAPATQNIYLTNTSSTAVTSTTFTPASVSGLTLVSVKDSSGNLLTASSGSYTLNNTSTNTFVSYYATYSWTDPNNSANTGTVTQMVNLFPAPVGKSIQLYANQAYDAADNFDHAINTSGQMITSVTTQTGAQGTVNGAPIQILIRNTSTGATVYSGSTSGAPTSLGKGSYYINYIISDGNGGTSESATITQTITDSTALTLTGTTVSLTATAAQTWNPSSLYSKSVNADTTAGSVATTNSYPVQVAIKDSTQTTNLVTGNASTVLSSNAISKAGTYYAYYWVLTGQGMFDYQAALATNSSLTLSQFRSTAASADYIQAGPVTITVTGTASTPIFSTQNDVIKTTDSWDPTKDFITGTDENGAVLNWGNSGLTLSVTGTESDGTTYTGNTLPGTTGNWTAGKYTLTYTYTPTSGTAVTKTATVWVTSSSMTTPSSTLYAKDPSFFYPAFTGVSGVVAQQYDSTNITGTAKATTSGIFSGLNVTMTASNAATGTATYTYILTDSVSGISTTYTFTGTVTRVVPSASNASGETLINSLYQINNNYAFPTVSAGSDSLNSNKTTVSNVTVTKGNASAGNLRVTVNTDGTVSASANQTATYQFTINYVDSFGNVTTAVDTLQVDPAPPLPFTGGTGVGDVLMVAGLIGFVAILTRRKRRENEY